VISLILAYLGPWNYMAVRRGTCRVLVEKPKVWTYMEFSILKLYFSRNRMGEVD